MITKQRLEIIIDELQREIDMRKKVYPKWAQLHRFGLTAEIAQARIQLMYEAKMLIVQMLEETGVNHDLND